MILRGGVRSVVTVDVLCDGHGLQRAPTSSLLLIHTQTHTHTLTHTLTTHMPETWAGEVDMWADEGGSQTDRTARQSQ